VVSAYDGSIVLGRSEWGGGRIGGALKA